MAPSNPAAFLRSRRRKLGLSVEELARRAGLRPRTCYSYEAGERSPSPQRLVALARALRLRPDALLRRYARAA